MNNYFKGKILNLINLYYSSKIDLKDMQYFINALQSLATEVDDGKFVWIHNSLEDYLKIADIKTVKEVMFSKNEFLGNCMAINYDAVFFFSALNGSVQKPTIGHVIAYLIYNDKSLKKLIRDKNFIDKYKSVYKNDIKNINIINTL